MRHSLVGQRGQARRPPEVQCAQRVVDHACIGAFAAPCVGRRLWSRRIVRHGIEQRPGCTQQLSPPGRNGGGTCNQVSATADVEIGIALHDGEQQRTDARDRQQLQRLHQGRVVTHRIATGRNNVGQHRFDVLAILELHQLRQHHALSARPFVHPTSG